jgi:hypothetical protein
MGEATYSHTQNGVPVVRGVTGLIVVGLALAKVVDWSVAVLVVAVMALAKVLLLESLMVAVTADLIVARFGAGLVSRSIQLRSIREAQADRQCHQAGTRGRRRPHYLRPRGVSEAGGVLPLPVERVLSRGGRGRLVLSGPRGESTDTIDTRGPRYWWRPQYSKLEPELDRTVAGPYNTDRPHSELGHHPPTPEAARPVPMRTPQILAGRGHKEGGHES